MFSKFVFIILLGGLPFMDEAGKILDFIQTLKNKSTNLTMYDKNIFIATNDTEYGKILAYLDKNSQAVIIFGRKTDEPSKQLFQYVQKQSKLWIGHYYFFKVDVDICDQAKNDFNINSVPVIVFRNYGNNVNRIDKNDGTTDFAKKLRRYIVQQNGTDLGISQKDNVVLYVENYEDFEDKMIYAKKNIFHYIVAFGNSKLDKEMFEFIKRTSTVWKEYETKIILVDIDKMPTLLSANGFTKTPAFIIYYLEYEKSRMVFDDDDYQNELNEFIAPRVPFYAKDGVDYTKKLNFIQQIYKKVIIVFDKETQSLYNTVVPFVQDKLSNWSKKYKILIVDIDLCQNTAKSMTIKTTPTFIFLKLNEEVKRIVPFLCNYENDLHMYIKDEFLDPNEMFYYIK